MGIYNMFDEVNSVSTLLTIGNLLICLFIIFLCICRLNSNLSKRFKLFRVKHILLLLAAMSLGLQPFFWAVMPGIGTTLASSLLLAYVLLNRTNFRG